MREASTRVHSATTLGHHGNAESIATGRSMPVPPAALPNAASDSLNVACWKPISARFASSCSRNGMTRRHRNDLRADVHVVIARAQSA